MTSPSRATALSMGSASPLLLRRLACVSLSAPASCPAKGLSLARTAARGNAIADLVARLGHHVAHACRVRRPGGKAGWWQIAVADLDRHLVHADAQAVGGRHSDYRVGTRADVV